jgi:acyl-CoA reductase-like NAD-dependent aldehyde dehydrogenase
MSLPESLQTWQQRASALARDARPVLDGVRTDALAPGRFSTTNPFNGSTVAEFAACGQADVDRAVASARAAHTRGDWAFASPHARQAVLHCLADLVEAHAEELALLDSLEMGMPIALAVPDMHGAAAALRETADLAATVVDQPLHGPGQSRAWNQRVPHGVMALITPWNFPAYVALGKVAAALAMGNAVVLKPSEVATLSCLRLADLAAQAGVPPGVFNALPGLGPQAGQALALHPDVDALSFTGSTATGRRLLAASGASNLKALILECGGKSPQLVFDDFGDPETLAQSLVAGFTWNSGQLCVAGTRLLVHRHLLGALRPVLQRAVQLSEAGLGDPLDPATTMGPLSSRAHWERVRGITQQAVEQGAQHLDESSSNSPLAACFMRPTILHGVDAQQAIVQEEVFGPVAVLMPFNDEAHAVQLANSTVYGLSASVWASDDGQGQRVAACLRAGFVTVNTKAGAPLLQVAGLAGEPAGQSGFGAEGGLAGLHSNSRARSVVISR